jgi:formylglycine-generating enzyme required for sulfatase activity
MLLVRKPDGSPWVFVGKEPVSHGAYAEMFPGQKKKLPNKRKNAKPVVKVAFVYAEAFAKGKQARLPTPEEWEAAARLEGFVPAADQAWEWVDDGSTGVQAPRALRAPDKQATRRPVAWADVTFRLAIDLPRN